jgi:hypothetical protein
MYATHIEHEAGESIYILKEYGLQAWLDMSTFEGEDEIIKCLNRMLKTLEDTDKFEDCIYLRDIIIPMYVRK